MSLLLVLTHETFHNIDFLGHRHLKSYGLVPNTTDLDVRLLFHFPKLVAKLTQNLSDFKHFCTMYSSILLM